MVFSQYHAPDPAIGSGPKAQDCVADLAIALFGGSQGAALAHGLLEPPAIASPDPLPPAERAAVAVEVGCRFLSRLEADKQALGHRFGLDMAALSEVTTGLSDPHNGGQSVIRLRDQSGRAVFYKPRPLEADAWFADFLTTHACFADGPDQRAPRYLLRAGYGWAEEIKPAPIATPEDAFAFNRRLGALLAVAWLLDLRDLHFENVVASGAYPVVLDAECVLVPALFTRRPWTEPHTVLTSGLLPTWVRDVRGKQLDPSAIGWFRRNAVSVGSHGDPLLDTFAATLHHLSTQAEALTGNDGGLERSRLATMSVRVTLRPTALYVDCMHTLNADANPGKAAAILERTRAEHRLPAAANYAEATSLARGDIPTFRAQAGGTEVVEAQNGQCVIKAVQSGLDACLERLARLHPGRIAAEHAIAATALGNQQPKPRRADTPTHKIAAQELGEYLARSCLVTPQGAFWPRLSSRRSASLTGPGIADGATGIAAALLALYAVTPNRCLLRPVAATHRAVTVAALDENWRTSIPAGLFGRAGIILFLSYRSIGAACHFAQRLGRALPPDTPDGLAYGLAGDVVALAWLAGKSCDALRAPLARAASVLAHRSAEMLPGLFFGRAGAGLALVAAGRALGRDKYVNLGQKLIAEIHPSSGPSLANGVAGHVLAAALTGTHSPRLSLLAHGLGASSAALEPTGNPGQLLAQLAYGHASDDHSLVSHATAGIAAIGKRQDTTPRGLPGLIGGTAGHLSMLLAAQGAMTPYSFLSFAPAPSSSP